MVYPPLRLIEACLIFPSKTCFEPIDAVIGPGARIGLIGRNGSGKSSLLKIIAGIAAPTSGCVQVPEGVRCAYVPQMTDAQELSGGEAFNAALSAALAQHPDVILLDEPTNHLDRHNRRALLRWCQSWSGTLVIASHDPELLETCTETIWHLEGGALQVFNGTYAAFQREFRQALQAREQEAEQLKRAEKETHEALMREQERAKKRRLHGEKKYAGDKLALRSAQGRGQATMNRHKKRIGETRHLISEAQAGLNMPEILHPTFSLSAAAIGAAPVLSVQDGAIGYGNQILAQGISLSLRGGDRLAIEGANGTGKTTLFKAILGDLGVRQGGAWQTPRPEDIGYLDQQYHTLEPGKTVLETLEGVQPTWTHAELRRHLVTFLFRNNAEVMARTETLSGGEKARLSLAVIAAKTPRLLLLDEITNNLDLDTRAHVVQILKQYPGALMVISHDARFLDDIGAKTRDVLQTKDDLRGASP